MAVVSEQLSDPGEAAAAPTIGGPVIACIDHGQGGRAAARIAGSLARRLDARLLLATVVQAPPRTPPGGDLTPGLVRRGRELLAGVGREIDRSADLRVAVGEPAERLIALAQREAAEFVVVAAPEASRSRTLVLGSVYLALVGAGACPVVIVPSRVARLPADGPIVCGIDGTEPSRIAARVAADLAFRLDAPLKLVHAARADPTMRSLRRIAEELPAATGVDLILEDGTPADLLRTVAERESAQLVVLGSHARGELGSALLGSVGSELATTATRPLVIVPPHARSPEARRAVILATRRVRDSAVLQVQGEIDSATAPELERQAARLLGETDGRLVVDLSETTFEDDAGARVTERLARRTSELGGRLALVANMPALDRIADRVSHSWLLVTDDLDAALEAVTNGYGARWGDT